MKLSRRTMAWIAGLAAAAALVIFSPTPQSDKNDGVVQPMAARKGGGAKRDSKVASANTILEIRPRGGTDKTNDEISDAFAPQSWTPPPPPPPENLKPTAPPLPFTVIGKKKQDGEWQVFLANHDRVHVVKATDVIDGVYRVEQLAPPTLTLIYLPLKIQQTLSIGSAEQ